MNINYKVIPLKWRPKTFEEIIGQDHIVRILKNSITMNRIAHAYLFIGPHGTGKTSMARIFAKALNCENGPSTTIDENSKICQTIINGSCMDVVEIDGASNNSIDQIRDLRDSCQYTPSQCRFKIYIIDEIHMLSSAAFNALLKILEEPPSYVKFIFATTEFHKILPTIVSRCQRFEFRSIQDVTIIKKLLNISSSEKINISLKAVQLIAKIANGAMRDAQYMLDQLITFADQKICEKDVLNAYGLPSRKQLDELVIALSSANYKAIIDYTEILVQEDKNLYQVLYHLQLDIHKQLVKSIKDDQSRDLKTLKPEAYMRIIEALQEGRNLHSQVSDQVNFEITLLRAAEHSKHHTLDTVIKNLINMNKAVNDEESKKKINY